MEIGPLFRSHVERCLQDAFELCSVVTDADGDYPFEHDGAVYYVRVIEAADTWWVRVWAPAVFGVKRSARLLTELNDIMATYPLVRALWREGCVYIEANMHASAVNAETLGRACRAVGDVTASMGETISVVYGGHRVTAPPSSCDEEVT